MPAVVARVVDRAIKVCGKSPPNMECRAPRYPVPRPTVDANLQLLQ